MNAILDHLAPESVTDLDAYAARACSIDQSDLVGEFSRVSADLAYFGTLAADAEAAYAAAENELKQLRAAGTLMAIAGGVKPQARVDATVEQTLAVQEARAAVVQRDRERRRLRAVTDAIGAKLQALISLGAQLRRELDSGRYAA